MNSMKVIILLHFISLKKTLIDVVTSHWQSQFTPKMTPLMWIEHHNECNGMTSFMGFILGSFYYTQHRTMSTTYVSISLLHNKSRVIQLPSRRYHPLPNPMFNCTEGNSSLHCYPWHSLTSWVTLDLLYNSEHKLVHDREGIEFMLMKVDIEKIHRLPNQRLNPQFSTM